MEKIRNIILRSVVFPSIIGTVTAVIAFLFILHEISNEYISSRREITLSTANLIYNNIQIFFTAPYVEHLIEDATKDIKDKDSVFMYYKGELFGNSGSEKYFEICRNTEKITVFKVDGKYLICYPIYTEIASSLLSEEDRKIDAIFGITFNCSSYVRFRNHFLFGIGSLFMIMVSFISILLSGFYKKLLSDISNLSELVETLKKGGFKVKRKYRFYFAEFTAVYKLLRQLLNKINVLIDRLREEATIDSVTQLSNRNFLSKLTDRLLALHERTQKPLSAAMIDIDDFKFINDTYGHRVGDNVLRKIGEIIKNSVRKSDLPFRYGGEEFLVLFPETAKEQAALVCERVKSSIEKEDFGIDRNVTVSIGISSMTEDTKNYISMEDLIKIADERLYRAKRGGKNKIIQDDDVINIGQ